MKVSSVILLITLAFLLSAMVASNLLLKKEYNKVDKGDLYWTYGKILEQPFKYLKIDGGNITNIAYEQNKNSSVRVFKNWDGYENGTVKAFVKSDTLFIKIPNSFKNQHEKDWLQWRTPVRIFSPELLSVEGINTNIGLFKLKQKSISVSLSGKSKLEVESYLPGLDTLNIFQKDSSKVVFEMSSDLMTSEPKEAETAGVKAVSAKAETLRHGDVMLTPAGVRKGWETMNIQYVNADLKNVSLLDIGHAQIKSLKLNITDSAAVILSGGTLKTIRK